MFLRPKGGDRAPATPDLWNYEGSKKGRQTLNRLELVKCSCGASNMVDPAPTSLATHCHACGKVVA